MLQVMRMYIYIYIHKRLYKYICVYMLLSLSIMCHPFRNCVCVFMFQGLQRTLMKSTKPIMGIWLSSFKGDRSR